MEANSFQPLHELSPSPGVIMVVTGAVDEEAPFICTAGFKIFANVGCIIAVPSATDDYHGAD